MTSVDYYVQGTKPEFVKGIEIYYSECQRALDRLDLNLKCYKYPGIGAIEYNDFDSFQVIVVPHLDAITEYGLEGPLISVEVEEFEDRTLENLVRNAGLPFDKNQVLK